MTKRPTFANPLARRNEMMQLVESFKEVPTLPASALRVMRLATDLESSAQELTQTISADQALAARVLRVVNSAYYGFSARVATISHAVVILGFQNVKNLAIGASVSELFVLRSKDFDILRLWEHSCAVAGASKLVACASGLREAEESYVGGLLHDIGKVVLANKFERDVSMATELAEREGIPFHLAEEKTYAWNHALIGAKLATSWNLAPCLRLAIGCHHSLPQAAPHAAVACAAHLGNWLAIRAGYTSGFSRDDERLQSEALTTLKLGSDDVTRLTVDYERARRDVEQLTAILQLRDSGPAEAA